MYSKRWGLLLGDQLYPWPQSQLPIISQRCTCPMVEQLKAELKESTKKGRKSTFRKCQTRWKKVGLALWCLQLASKHLEPGMATVVFQTQRTVARRPAVSQATAPTANHLSQMYLPNGRAAQGRVEGEYQHEVEPTWGRLKSKRVGGRYLQSRKWEIASGGVSAVMHTSGLSYTVDELFHVLKHVVEKMRLSTTTKSSL